VGRGWGTAGAIWQRCQWGMRKHLAEAAAGGWKGPETLRQDWPRMPSKKWAEP
jgi:hypothetical protein